MVSSYSSVFPVVTILQLELEAVILVMHIHLHATIYIEDIFNWSEEVMVMLNVHVVKILHSEHFVRDFLKLQNIV